MMVSVAAFLVGDTHTTGIDLLDFVRNLTTWSICTGRLRDSAVRFLHTTESQNTEKETSHRAVVIIALFNERVNHLTCLWLHQNLDATLKLESSRVYGLRLVSIPIALAQCIP